MASGIVISKPGFTVEDEPLNHYVNTETPLLKTYKVITGKLLTNGTTYSSEGEYQFTGTMYAPGSGSTTALTLTIPHDLKYVPMAIGYLDTQSGAKRRYLTGSNSGVSLEGDISGFFHISPTDVKLTIQGKSTGMIPGDYGYYIGIYYLPLTPAGASSFYA